MLKQQFIIGEFKYTPMHCMTINGVSAQKFEIRRLLDGAWVLYRTAYAPKNLTRSKLMQYLEGI